MKLPLPFPMPQHLLCKFFTLCCAVTAAVVARLLPVACPLLWPKYSVPPGSPENTICWALFHGAGYRLLCADRRADRREIR
jgi:hypothetical protein